MRRVWIIAKREQVEESDIADALLNGCPEIANGIPPALEETLSPDQLPIAFEEPEPLPPELTRNLIKEIDALRQLVAAQTTEIGELQSTIKSFDARLKQDIGGHSKMTLSNLFKQEIGE